MQLDKEQMQEMMILHFQDYIGLEKAIQREHQTLDMLIMMVQII
jgi:hypothetical protein